MSDFFRRAGHDPVDPEPLEKKVGDTTPKTPDVDNDTLRKVTLPGEKVIVKLKKDGVVDDDGIAVDKVVSEVSAIYKAAFHNNDAKFFDAVIAMVSRLTSVPAAELIDPDRFDDALAAFKRNAVAINNALRNNDKKDDNPRKEKENIFGVGHSESTTPKSTAPTDETEEQGDKTEVV